MAGEDPHYIAWIKQQPCAVMFCRGHPIEAHHRIQERYSQHRVHDTETIPLCAAHHHELHQFGIQTFRAAYEYDEWREVARHRKRYFIWEETDDERPF